MKQLKLTQLIIYRCQWYVEVQGILKQVKKGGLIECITHIRKQHTGRQFGQSYRLHACPINGRDGLWNVQSSVRSKAFTQSRSKVPADGGCV